jgi:hypothetical protein
MLKFVDHREIVSVEQLSEPQRAQLVAAAGFYGIEEATAETLLADDGSEESFHGFCHHYRIVEGDELKYDAWLYQVDSGTIFVADTTESVAEVIQFGLECEDPELELELGVAMVEAGLLPKGDSEFERFTEELEKRRK